MHALIIDDISKLPIEADTWNTMVEKNETNSIFQTFEWLDAWWHAFSSDHELFIICIYDNDELVGIAPLTFRSHGNTSDLVFIGDGNSDYLDFIIIKKKEQVIHHILESIYSHKNKWNNFLLRNIPECSTSIGLIISACKDIGIQFMENHRIACPTLLIRNRESILESMINKYSIRRSYQRLNKKGNLTHRVFSDINEATANLETFFNQHIDRWKSYSYQSPFLLERNKQFYKLLINNLLPSNKVLFSAVIYNNEPIAFHFGFDYNESIIWYKPSFSPSFAKFSPGLILVRFLMLYALKNNKYELDFTIGNEAFKERFINIKRYNVSMRFFNSSYNYYITIIKSVIIKTIKIILLRK